MKLLIENWNKYLKEEVGPFPFSSVIIQNPEIVLSSEDVVSFLNKYPNFQTEKCGTTSCVHHMTITMGPLKEKYGWGEGEQHELTATHIGVIDNERGRAMAIKVQLPLGKSTKNKGPHITIAVPLSADSGRALPPGKPFHSNKIKEWVELNTPISGIKGVVAGGTMG